MFEFKPEKIDWEEIYRDERLRLFALAAGLGLFTLLLALWGGVRGVGLFLIWLVVTVTFTALFMALPKEDAAARFRRMQSGTGEREYPFYLQRLGMELFRKPTREPLVVWFDPGIDDDDLLNALVYLSSNGYVIDDGFTSMLDKKQGKQLRIFMLEKGFAYETDEVFEGGWALNAAGRSIINRYLTYILIADDTSSL